MEQLVRDGMTMVLVSHEMGFARESADRIFFMDEGRFVEIGPPEQTFDDPQDERTAGFLGAFTRMERRNND